MRRVIAILIVASMMLPAALVDAEDAQPTPWLTEEVANLGYAGALETAIAIDHEGTVHVAYPTGLGGVMLARRSTGGSWVAEVARPVPHGPASILGLSLVLDSRGSYHMVFQEDDHGSIHCIRDGEVVSTVSQSGSYSLAFPSLAIDGDDRLHLCYYDADLGGIVYAVKEPSGDLDPRLVTSEDFNKSGRTAIAVDADGRAHILFAANWPYASPYPYFDLNYLTVGPDGTVSEIQRKIASNVEGPLSMALAEDGTPHIAFTVRYYDLQTHSFDVRVFHCVRGPEGEWSGEQPFESGYLGRFPSIAVDADGGVHISGHCEILDCLKFCYRSPEGRWTIQTVEHTGDTGRYTSLAIDEANHAHIAYFDFNNTRIRYATNALVPTPPRDLLAISGVLRVTLSWQTPRGEGSAPLNGFVVHRLGPGETTPTLVKFGPLARTFVDKNVEAGSVYSYWVTATNIYGESLPSSRVTGVPLDPGSSVLPEEPRDLRAVAGDGWVNLTWRPPAVTDGLVITGYLLYWMPTDAGPIWSPPSLGTLGWYVLALPGEVTEFAHAGLTNGVTYCYAVSALVEEGEGEASPIVAARPRRLPSAPWGLWGKLVEGSVHIHWTPPSVVGDVWVTAYRVYRGASPDSMEPLATLETRFLDWGLYLPAPTNYTDDDVGQRTAWYYQVTAVNSLGEGPPSEAVRVGPVGPPSAPRDLEATLGDEGVDLAWRFPVDDGGTIVSKFLVYRRVQGGNMVRLATLTDGRLSFHDLDVAPGSAYDYWVSASNSAGEGPLSPMASVSLPPGEGGTRDVPDDGTRVGGPSGSLLLLILFVLSVLVASALLAHRRQS